MATQTGSIDLKAPKNANDDARKVASNYLSSDSSGIMIYDGTNGTEQMPSAPDATTNNVFIDSDSLDIRQGTEVLATFGADETIIGKRRGIGSEGASQVIIDSQTMRIQEPMGTAYFKVGDLRKWETIDDKEVCVATIRETFIGDGEKTKFTVSSTVSYPVSATDSSDSSNTATRNGQIYTFTNPPGWKALVEITYKTTQRSRLFTFGERRGYQGSYSVAMGRLVEASGHYSHAEGSGYNTENITASGEASHAEGIATKAIGKASHAEGLYGLKGSSLNKTVYTTASGEGSHAEGSATSASGKASHAEGTFTTAESTYDHAEGYWTIAKGGASHAEGTTASWRNNVDGSTVTEYTTASGLGAHAEGAGTKASGKAAHSEGTRTGAGGDSAHSEGYMTSAIGDHSHAEGTTYEYYDPNNASFGSHYITQWTKATGKASHAEGAGTQAIGDYSHTQNYGTIAKCNSQTALGKYNVEDSGTGDGTYAVIVGNGTGHLARSNALTVDWNGNVDIASGAQYKINGVSLADIFYPVGSYYKTSDADFDPNTAWGGTWSLASSKDAYIVDEGTDGIWTYRKWSDGMAECWGSGSKTMTNYATSNNFRGYYTDFALPSGLFISSPQHVYTSTVDSGFAMSAAGLGISNTNFRVYALATSTGSQSCTFEMFAKGKWSNTSEVYYRWHRTA